MSVKAVIVDNGKETILNNKALNGTFEDIISSLKVVQTSCEVYFTKLISNEVNGDPRKKMKLDNDEEENVEEEEPELDNEGVGNEDQNNQQDNENIIQEEDQGKVDEEAA